MSYGLFSILIVFAAVLFTGADLAVRAVKRMRGGKDELWYCAIAFVLFLDFLIRNIAAYGK